MNETEANREDSPKHPHTLFGGTWERIKDRFILAAGPEHPINYYPVVDTLELRPASFSSFKIGDTNTYAPNGEFSKDETNCRYICQVGIQYLVNNTEYKQFAISWYYDDCERAGNIHTKNHIEIEGLISDESQGSIWNKVPIKSNLEIYMNDGTVYTITPEMTAQAAQQNTSIDPEIVFKGIGGASKHILSIQEMPKHEHRTLIWDYTQTGLGFVTYDGTKNKRCLTVDVDAAPGETINPHTGLTGGNQPHNNMPPYKTAYCWMRVPDPISI